MYGTVDGVMNEQTPSCPCLNTCELRAQIATMLLNEMKTGNLTALIARSADFYGPRGRTRLHNVLVFDKLSMDAKASWVVNDSAKHSFTFTPDAARSLVLLADSESAWNRTWHVPSALDPPTRKQFIELVA